MSKHKKFRTFPKNLRTFSCNLNIQYVARYPAKYMAGNVTGYLAGIWISNIWRQIPGWDYHGKYGEQTFNIDKIRKYIRSYKYSVNFNRMDMKNN